MAASRNPEEDHLPPSDHPYDPTFTANVIAAMGPETNPRLRTVLSSLITHLHAFARDVHLTTDEWLAGVEVINRAGQMSTDRRNEGQLLCDVVGLESLVDEITYVQATRGVAGATATATATATAILGPFWRKDTPWREYGDTVSFDTPKDGQVAYVHGRVTSATTGQPLANAEIDIWQASTNGLYEQQDPAQVEHNLRGKFRTREDGTYAFYCLRPTPYPVPNDGPAGQLLELMDRHPFRPAHIHFIVLCPGHKPITTQIFDADSAYLDDDSVFAVKQSLIVKFERKPREKHGAEWDLHYDVKMAENDKDHLAQ